MNETKTKMLHSWMALEHARLHLVAEWPERSKADVTEGDSVFNPEPDDQSGCGVIRLRHVSSCTHSSCASLLAAMETSYFLSRNSGIAAVGFPTRAEDAVLDSIVRAGEG